ncbi:uncharacterized protein PRCAT00000926001 [Priceomyces carsonii]|uniref:uncharacterized protein n=1 Tax=Priceomyces carsonii TaxID=28549 RepID=UPI002ED7AFE6|nr:unnamed protein product [Priceomyces carsonii]
MLTIQSVGATTKLSQHEILPAKTDVGALANRINANTKECHDKVNKQMALKLAIALRDPKIYRQGVQSFYHVFSTIERCLNDQVNANNEWSLILKQIWKPEVARTEKCETDLLFYYDDDRKKFMNPVMPEQIKFVNHIETVTKEKPYLLLAYMHVMYLALFAGGKVLRSSVSKATGLFPHKDGLKHEDVIKLGANMFIFDVADESLLRMIYKRDYELLTRNNLTEAQKLDIIEESKYIFAQNSRCISEIEKHNLVKITKKWSYIIATRGYYIAIFSLILALLYFVRRIFLHLF